MCAHWIMFLSWAAAEKFLSYHFHLIHCNSASSSSPTSAQKKSHSPQHLLTHFVVECCKCFNCQFRHCLLSEFLSALRSCWYGSAHSSDNEVIPLGLLKHCLNLAPLSLFVESSSPHFADADESWSWKLLNAFDLRAGVWEMQEWMQFPIANWSISDESLQELNFFPRSNFRDSKRRWRLSRVDSIWGLNMRLAMWFINQMKSLIIDQQDEKACGWNFKNFVCVPRKRMERREKVTKKKCWGRKMRWKQLLNLHSLSLLLLARLSFLFWFLF